VRRGAARLGGTVVARHGPVSRCFGAFEQLQLPLALVRERLQIPGLASAAARNFRDKARMKDVLRAAGVPVARHRLIGTHADAETFVREVGFPIVVKPPAAAGARATHRVANAAEHARQMVMYPPSTHDPMLAEEFLLGLALARDRIRQQTRCLAFRRIISTPLTVIENPWISGESLPREVDAAYDDIRAVGARANRAGHGHRRVTLRMVPPIGRESRDQRDRRSAARRKITTMISRAHDIPFVRAWVSLMVHGTFEAPARR
jgi:hypothetical protein